MTSHLITILVIIGLLIIYCLIDRKKGCKYLISHAIDEYFPDKSTIHGIQVGWAHAIIAKQYRRDTYGINLFYEKIGLYDVYKELIPWQEDDFDKLIPYAREIRNRFTIFNVI